MNVIAVNGSPRKQWNTATSATGEISSFLECLLYPYLTYTAPIGSLFSRLIGVGFRSLEVINNALGVGGMDYISMSRPFIREPHLIKRCRDGDQSPALCISCNGCFKPGREEGGIYCVAEKKETQKKHGLIGDMEKL